MNRGIQALASIGVQESDLQGSETECPGSRQFVRSGPTARRVVQRRLRGGLSALTVEYLKVDARMIGFLTRISEVNPGSTMGISYLFQLPISTRSPVSPSRNLRHTNARFRGDHRGALRTNFITLGDRANGYGPLGSPDIRRGRGRAATRQFDKIPGCSISGNTTARQRSLVSK